MIRYLEWNKRGYKLNYKNIFKKKELKMESFFNNILGKMNIEEKVAQLFVFAIHGPLPDTNLIEFIKKYGVGGLRIQPCSDRKAAKYMSDGGIVDQRTVRHPVWGEKFPDTSIRSSIMPPKQYAGFLNGIRSSSATFKKYGVPVHTVMDGEEGGGDYGAPHIISMPQQMGFGELGDMELLAESWEAFARQYKAVGIDWIHSPVVDVNVNPKNPEISTRAFSSNADVVTKCAEVEISALKRGGLISCVKHFPGRGDSDSDAHFGVPTIEAEIGKMEAIHLKPYHDLIKKGVVQSVMLAHSVYPALDNSGELATVSEIIIKKLLRGKLGFRGVITTDALTMGGLMKMHSVDEACIMTIAAGTDLLLHKSETSLRFEPFHALVNAVKSGRIAESVIDESLCRNWQLKYDMGLFEKGGIVDPSRAEAIVEDPKNDELGYRMSRAVAKFVRKEEGVLPLDNSKRILVVDRIIDNTFRRNNYWNYPGMIAELLRKYTDNFSWIEYTADTVDNAEAIARQLLDHVDVIVVTTDYDRSSPTHDGIEMTDRLAMFGKPVIQISDNPYRELCVSDKAGTVLITWGLMREQIEAALALLFEK